MNWVALFLERFEGFLRKIKKSILWKTNPQFREVSKWHKDDPHDLKRSDFDSLTEDSVVFDLGGYEGRWSSDIYARYKCNIYVFEPVTEYANLIKDRFKNNHKIKVFPLGLADRDSKVSISINLFASRIATESNSRAKKEIVQLKDFKKFVRENEISNIDLIKINIEGSEYDLLEYLIQTGAISNINILLIQFHVFVEDASQRRREIQKNLERTHDKIFDYPFVWECWQIKK